MHVKATRGDQVFFLFSPSLSFPLARVEFVLTVLAFNGTLVPRESICLPGSYAASCQPRRDWLLQIKDCITCLRGLMRRNYPHHPNDVWCASVTKTQSARASSEVTSFFCCITVDIMMLILWIKMFNVLTKGNCFICIWGCDALDLSTVCLIAENCIFFFPLNMAYIIPNSSLLTVTALFHTNDITWPLWRGIKITHKHLILEYKCPWNY